MTFKNSNFFPAIPQNVVQATEFVKSRKLFSQKIISRQTRCYRINQ